MSRWWRAYDEAVDDPKLQRLKSDLFKAWFNLCCITSQNGGHLPDFQAIAFKLRCSPDKAKGIVRQLCEAGLIDECNDSLQPHNWNRRQFQSDTSTERVKRFREHKRNVSSAVSETPPYTETETETERTGTGERPLGREAIVEGQGVVPLRRGGA